MDEHHIVRSMLLRIAHGVRAQSPLAAALLDWAQPHRTWLLANDADSDEDLAWDDLAKCTDAARPSSEAPAPVLALACDLARLLDLSPVDTALLTLMIACDRLPRVTNLAALACRHGRDLPTLLGELAGAESREAARIVHRSDVMRLGLIGFAADRKGEVTVDIRWSLERLLDRAPAAGPDLLDALIGKRQHASLALEDFAHVRDAGFLVALLEGAAREKAHGVNILIHGPPGTGKTEFARTLANAAGCQIHGIGEADEDGEEPSRWDRVFALQLAHRVLGDHSRAVLLFEEMEDLIGDTQRASGSVFTRREGSKVFINRMLETNPAPVIWTTNAIGNVDGAILRRMSFILELDIPPRSAALRMLERIASDEGTSPGSAMGALIERAPETATVLRVATRAARLAGDTDGGARSATSLVRALRGGDLPMPGAGLLDLGLFETDRPLEAIFAIIREREMLDVSLLLTGPPGTGKTALAHHLARALDRPLLVKRGSDLLSKWVGETEQRIAAAFEEARQREGVLLFDEADSLLFDRTAARTSWEVGQVNEMLTWLDQHPFPVVAATNFPGQLDPATLRRFVFKLSLAPLGPERSVQAFERFFNMPAPPGLNHLRNLTPGDFAVVARQLRHAPALDSGDILGRLAAESGAKPQSGVRVGF